MNKIEGKSITKYIMSFVSIICIFIFYSTAYAEGHLGTSGSDKLWGIGGSITYPLNQIYEVQASYSLSQDSDVLCGVAYQNWQNNQGKAHAYTLLLGYRQYIWRGLHVEAELWPAYNPFESSVDGKTYSGFELWMSLRVGYKFDFKLSDKDFFILVQPSTGFGVARENLWPGGENDGNAIFEPQIVAGMRF